MFLKSDVSHQKSEIGQRDRTKFSDLRFLVGDVRFTKKWVKTLSDLRKKCKKKWEKSGKGAGYNPWKCPISDWGDVRFQKKWKTSGENWKRELAMIHGDSGPTPMACCVSGAKAARPYCLGGYWDFARLLGKSCWQKKWGASWEKDCTEIEN